MGSRTSVAVSHVQIRSSAVEEGSRLLQFEIKTRDITDIIFYVCKTVEWGSSLTKSEDCTLILRIKIYDLGPPQRPHLRKTKKVILKHYEDI